MRGNDYSIWRCLSVEQNWSTSNKIRTIIKARGLWYPNVQGKTFAVFRVDKYHHLMSLLSMLGPSPDWIVGVSALELCLKNCSWVTEKVMNLYPWDAGTDSGHTYLTSKSATVPQEKIRRITSSTPNNPLSPFYDSTGQPMKPVARLTVTRQRVYDKNCDDYEVPGFSTTPDVSVIEDDRSRTTYSIDELQHA
ncbi:UNVERIFIED_CONTAM: Spondin-1 [Trichonephila clavipes]